MELILLVGTQKHLLVFLNYCKSERVSLILLIQFQLLAGAVVSKSGPGCLSVSDLLPGRLLALSDLLHVYGKSLQRDKVCAAHMKHPSLTLKFGIYLDSGDFKAMAGPILLFS